MSVRRGLPVLSLGLIALGLEISSGVLTESSARILRDLGSVAAGEPPSVYPPAFFAGLLAIALGVAGLAASLWSRAIHGRLTSGKRCPECGERTSRIERRRWQRILGRALDESVQRRWCRGCGWKGLCRIRG